MHAVPWNRDDDPFTKRTRGPGTDCVLTVSSLPTLENPTLDQNRPLCTL
jgi:hypothetical protein